MTPYPKVMSESETLDHVLCGKSLARYGDGEFHLAWGRGIPCQPFDERLSQRLRDALTGSRCLVGIPNIESATPKAKFWSQFRRASELLNPGFLKPATYASSFVTRPDSAPWIDTPEYWAKVERLWAGLDVVLVRGSGRSLMASDLTSARSVREVVGPRRDAWSKYEALLDEVGIIGPDRVLLCLGPTATVMALDLAAYGVHAVDVGHVGMFLRKHRRGESMTMTAEDHAA